MINRRAITITLTIANLCVFVIFVSGWVNPLAQDNKTIVRRLTFTKEPVEISFKLKGQPVNSRKVKRPVEGISTEEFEGDPDWLKDLTFKVRNTSEKTITYLALNLHFPEVTKNGATGLHQIFLGVDPDGKFPRAELRLAPNQTTEIPLAAMYDNIKNLVRAADNSRIENVSKLSVDFSSALFEDGTLFEGGTTWRRNPDPNGHPKWIRIDNR